jgi:transposase
MPKSLSPFQPIPKDTARTVSAVIGKGNVYRAIGDQGNLLFTDINPADLDVSGGKSLELTATLAMVTIFQFAEDLPDRQAVEALHSRMDWKYALHLPMNNPALDVRALCNFRSYLLHNPKASQTMQNLITSLARTGLFRKKSEQQVNVSEVLSRVCFISRLADVMESMLLTLEALAAYKPELLRENASPLWYERYDRRHFPFQIPGTPQEQEGLVQAIGVDASYLMEIMTGCEKLGFQLMPEERRLQQLLNNQYENRAGEARWRPFKCASCGQTTPISA